MHCDLKPENILLENENSSRIKIIDLGLSQVNDKAKPLKTERGSIHYLAPEVILNNYNHKVDIWAAGVIFYVLLTGKLPFHAVKPTPEGQSVVDGQRIKQLILQGKVDYSHAEFKALDPIFENIIRHMLQMDPSKRPEASQLLSLPFFRSSQVLQFSNQGRPGNAVLEEVYNNIFQMNKGSYLKKGIALYFANYFELKEEKNKFHKYFSMIDADRNGLIFFDEFVQAYQFKVGAKRSTRRKPRGGRCRRSTSFRAGTRARRCPSWSSFLRTSTSRSS